MHKKFLYPIIFFCCALSGQTPTNNLIQDDNHFAQATLMRELLRIQNKGPIDISEIDGSPFANKNYQIAELINEKQGTRHKYSVRYNAYLDRMETPRPNGTIGALKKTSFFTLKLNGSTYKVFDYINKDQKLSNGYFALIIDNDSISLLRRDVKVFQEGKPAKTTFHPPTPAKFLDETAYYLKFPDRPALEVPSKKKDFISLFKNNQNDISAFIKQNRLKTNNQADLEKIVEFYLTLTN